MEKELKVVAIKFDLTNEAQKQYYEELLKLDDGTFANISAYAKAIVVGEMKRRLHTSKNPELDYDLLAAKVAEILNHQKEPEMEDVYGKLLG